MSADVYEIAIRGASNVAVDVRSLRAIASRVLEGESYPPGTEVSLELITDDRMAELNAGYLQGSGPTDVLSFPLADFEPGSPPRPAPGAPPVSLGDVFIAPDYVARQAEELGVEVADELALMVVHGLLHLMGYDHVEDGEAEVMEGRERDLLAGVGVARR